MATRSLTAGVAVCLLVCGLVNTVRAAGEPRIDSVTVSPSPDVTAETVVTVTVKAVPADPKDVLGYILWGKNGTFSEWAPLYATSACEYFPPPLVPGPGKVRVPSEWNEWNDADGVLTFTADAVPGTYELGFGVTVVSGPNTKAHSRSSFHLTITPLVQPTDAATSTKTVDPRFDFDIVVAEDAIPSEAYAAREYRKFFAKASGVALPIVTDPGRPRRHVFIGPSEALRRSSVGFSVEKMGPEDLRIVVRDGTIAIAGGRPRGTLYGVYAFLEDHLGVRFFTHDHTYVPPLQAWPPERPVDRSYRPPLEFRECSYREMNASPLLAARLRCNTIPNHAKFGGITGRRLINHSFQSQIPTKTYGKEHPEYYALVDGKRRATVPPDMDWRHTQPCLTNPGVLRIVTDAVLSQIRRRPDYSNVSVSQNDNHNYCRCPLCAATDEREGTPMGSLLTFVNAVADEVAGAAPGVKVGTLAYAYSRKPPKTVKPSPNVQIQLCALEASVTKPIADPGSQRNAAFREDLKAWGRVCDDICIWYYNVNFYDYHLPNPNLRVLEPNIRFFVANGVRGMLMQAAYTSLGTEFSDLRNYVTCKLLWNPQLSGQQLIDEFLDLHYREAAPPIRRFINLIHDTCEAKGLDTPFGGKWEQFGIDDSIARAGLEAFDEALRLAGDDVTRARVEKASICAYRMAIEDAYTWDIKTGRLPEEIARRTRPYVERMFTLCDKYSVTNFTEGLTIDKRQDPNRPFPGYRVHFNKLFGLKPGESF